MDNTTIAIIGAMLGAIVVTAMPYIKKKYWQKKAISFDWHYLAIMVGAIIAACWAVYNGIEGLLIQITSDMDWVTALLLGLAYGGATNTAFKGAIYTFLAWWDAPTEKK